MQSDGPEVVHLTIHGPFPLYAPMGQSIFDQDLSRGSGIYVYSVPYGGAFLASYVGETGRSFLDRIRQHSINTLGGYERIYEPEDLCQGKKILLWGGPWQKSRQNYYGEFLDRYADLAPKIAAFIQQFQLFLLPLACEDRLRRRIESAVARYLYAQPGVIGGFMDAGIRYYRGLKPGEEPVPVEIHPTPPILGFPSRVLA